MFAADGEVAIECIAVFVGFVVLGLDFPAAEGHARGAVHKVTACRRLECDARVVESACIEVAWLLFGAPGVSGGGEIVHRWEPGHLAGDHCLGEIRMIDVWWSSAAC